MRRFFFILSTMLCIVSMAGAQSFTQHLQRKEQGKPSVTLTQSREIEALVDGADVSARKTDAATRKTDATTAMAQQKNNAPTKKQNTHEQTPIRHPAQQHNGDSARAQGHEAARAQGHEAARTQGHEPTHTTAKADASDMDIPTVDMRKKVMRRSYKVNGYRVQVFAGGNSRDDKIKAQNAGNAVKMAFPSQPIYVHFYSPRWICRMGNYRTYEEASAILSQVKKMGYKQACIVSGKITVAY